MTNHPERKRNRLKNYNYSRNGWYFITICVQNRMKYFGQIVGNGRDRSMILNKFGEIVKQQWLEIPNHYGNCRLDQFVVMPNHFHGIVVIHNDSAWNNPVGNADLRSLQNDRTKMYLSKIVHGFKSTVTRKINEQNHNALFHWQKSFYDSIIRDKKSLFNIRQYIINNPLKWPLDDNNLMAG